MVDNFILIRYDEINKRKQIHSRNLQIDKNLFSYRVSLRALSASLLYLDVIDRD